MPPDTDSPYGQHAPKSKLVSALISLSQKAPRNFLSHQFAKLARTLVRRNGQVPLDLSVGEMKLRCYLWDNYTERKFIFMPWRFDRRERKIIFSALPREGVFVDIGANVGVFTLQAALQLGAKGRVLALEPYPPIFERLLFNIKATREGRETWPTIDVLPIGVANEVRNFELHLNKRNLGQNSIVASMPTPSLALDVTATVTVPCEPLLDILNKQEINRIDVLKIDIEGAEDLALGPFLSRAPESLLPSTILIEDSSNRWQIDLCILFEQRGYKEQFRSRMNIVYQRPAQVEALGRPKG